MRWGAAAMATLTVALVAGCTSVEGRTETAVAIAERLQLEVRDDLAQAARSGRFAQPDGPDLGDAVDRMEPPDGARLLSSGAGQANVEGGRATASTAVVVVPDGGDLYCIVVAVASDGSSAGVAAEGDPQQSCRDAQVGGLAPTLILDTWG